MPSEVDEWQLVYYKNDQVFNMILDKTIKEEESKLKIKLEFCFEGSIFF